MSSVGGSGSGVPVFPTGGGLGGDGGAGVIFNGANSTFSNFGTVRGGLGGIGGNESQSAPGGAGGDGVVFSASGATLFNGIGVQILGGNGGSATETFFGLSPGGAGGAGVVLSGGASLNNQGSIQGGTGGDTPLFTNASGGAGGAAVKFTGPGGTIFNGSTGIILGGNGGMSHGTAPISAGGPGITGAGLTIENHGTIAGGHNGDFAPVPFAIVLTGGTNAVGGDGTITNGGIQLQAGSLMPALPGSVVGPTLHMIGGPELAPGSTYLIRVNGAASDSITVIGAFAATVGGASVVTTIQSFILGQRDTIITAASINGTFASSTTSTNSAFLIPVISYDATHVYETITGNGANGQIDYGKVAQTQNQSNVGHALTGAGLANGFSGPLFSAINFLSAPQARAAFDQIDGEVATGAQQTTFNAMNLFMGVMTDPFMAGRGNPVSAGGGAVPYANETQAYASAGKSRSERDAYAAVTTKAPPLAPFEQRWSVWIAGFGGSEKISGDPVVVGSHDVRASVYGGAVGVDYRFSPDTLAGVALAGGGTNFNLTGSGSGRSDLFQAGAFFRHNIGPAYITGALAYGWQDITTDRIVTVAGFDRLRAEFNANAWSGRIEGGYRLVAPIFGGVGITPYAAGQSTTFDLPTYMEQAIAGSNLFALTYNSKSVTDIRTEVGVRADRSFATSNGVLIVRGRLAWAHDYDTGRAVSALFQSLPGTSFVVNGARPDADSALVTAGVERKWLNGFSLAGTFEGEFSGNVTSYAGKGIVKYSW
jgi:uncharacterized protein with beta-barrel porin domain